MGEDAPNPYSPPSETLSTESDQSIESLLGSGPIRFHGSVNAGDLNAFLRSHDHIGCGSILMTGVGLSAIMFFFALVIHGALALVFVGVLGLVLLSLVTSMLPYRRSVFVSANPKWQEPVTGEVVVEGVVVRREGGESFFGWDWFGDAVADSHVVAFLPAMHSHQPILISSSMLDGLSDWDRLNFVAQSLAVSSDDSSTFESRRYENRKRMRSSRRGRSLEVPPDAIAFEGAVTTRDLKELPARISRRSRPARAYLLIFGLAAFMSVLLIGLMRLGGDSLLATILFMLVALVLVLSFVVRRIRSMRAPVNTVYYLAAFADESGLTSDFGVTNSHVPWQQIVPTRLLKETVLLARADVRQFIVARRDMFENEQDWQRFRELLDKKL